MLEPKFIFQILYFSEHENDMIITSTVNRILKRFGERKANCLDVYWLF